MRYIKEYTINQFYLQPQDKQNLNYTKDIIEDAQFYQYELPPLDINKQNILLYWSEGNQLYIGLKILILIPAIINISYYMLINVSDKFRAFCKYQKSQLNQAQQLLIKLQIKTSLNKTLDQTIMIPIYHYWQQGSYHQQIIYENEIYILKQEENQIHLLPKYQQQPNILEIQDTQSNLTQQQVLQRQEQYGMNQIKIKYPQFLQIAKEELLTPYFAFQIISSLLYFLDNYGTFSIMNIVILLFSEASNIYQKYISLRNTVKLAPKTCLVNVIRDNKEMLVNSRELVIGDHVIYRKTDYDQVIEYKEEKIEEQEQQRKPTQLEILKQQGVYKMIFRIYDLIFAKYYDQSIQISNNEEKRSLIFAADMVLTQGRLISDESNLTGEQASQIKEQIQNDQIQNSNMVFAGTQLIQLQDEECHFIVKNTRTYTQQGELIKEIIFGDDRMKMQSSDSTIFLILMSICALFSSIYTFRKGYQNQTVGLSNLILECLIIFIQIIPADLPSQLSMVITEGIASLREKKIFSTNPYKLLNSGCCQCVCFDKSGTLTQSDLTILGVDEHLNDLSYQTIIKNKNNKKPQININNYSKLIIAGCNSVTKLQNQVLGDLLEINAIKTCLQDVQINDNQIKYSGSKIDILKRFYFTSNVKRMSCIIQQNNQQYTVIKGSPEIIYQLLKQKPSKYNQILNKYTNNGFRVLALAYKQSFYSLNEMKQLQREQVEKDFEFAGFLVCQTPLKTQTKQSIQKLKQANVNIKVISGDYIVNVVVSSSEAGIINQKQQPLLIKQIDDQNIILTNPEQTQEEQFKLKDIDDLMNKYTLCASGQIISDLLQNDKYNHLINKITIFARTTPKQKSDIIQQLQKKWVTVYVGDGVNDLTALKVSDVGIALLSEINDKEAQQAEQQAAKKIPYPRIMQQPGNRPASYQQLIQAANNLSMQNRTPINYELQILLKEQQQYKAYLKLQKLNNMSSSFYSILNAFESENDLEDNATQTATIAASFSSKISQISSVIEIIRQGSGCLDKVRFNYIQNALVSIIGAYSMTVMTSNGVRSNNQQQIVSSILYTIIQFLFSRLKPIDQIKIIKQQQKLVDFKLIMSALLQSFIHILVLFLIQKFAMEQMQVNEYQPTFKPTMLNTCVFYIQIIQDFSVILANFVNLRLQVNKYFVISLLVYVGLFLSLLFEIESSFNEQIGLVLLPQNLQFKVAFLSFFDLFASMAVQYLLYQ